MTKKISAHSATPDVPDPDRNFPEDNIEVPPSNVPEAPWQRSCDQRCVID